MANLTRQQLDQANIDLINVDPLTGEKIASVDHRAMNDNLASYGESYAPIEVTVAINGTIEDERLRNRRVGCVISENGIIMSPGISKPFADAVLTFVGDASLLPGTLAVINFLQST